MDKVTKVAVEKYPHGTFDGELGDSLRAACAVGYMQAEKDLALTWEDIQAIIHIFFLVSREEQFQGTEPPYFCEEVLRRFNEQRRK